MQFLDLAISKCHTAPVPDPTPESRNSQDAPRSPFAGCLILVVMGIVVLILITTTVYTLKKQTQAYQTFTEEEAKPAQVINPADFQNEFNSLVSRLRHFEHEVKNNRRAEIALTPRDLNLAIAHFDILADLRGQFFIAEISDQEISGTLHLPFSSNRKLPSFVRTPLKIPLRDNNLNGTFTGTPLLTDGKLILNLTEITPSRGEMPDDFFSNISRVLVSGQLEKAVEDDPENPPDLLKTLRKLTSLSLRDGTLIFTHTPGATPPSVKEQADAMATKAKQFIALGAVIFILTMILLFLLLSRRQKAKREALREEKRENI